MSEVRHSLLKYGATLVGLLVLTTVSLLSALYVSAPGWELVIAIAIAAAKATLIALFFIHLIEQPFGNALALLTGGVMVSVLIVFIVFDVGFR